jgi:hypothetical protein
MRNFRLSALFFLLSLTAGAQTRTVFVSATGNDEHTGRLQSPFKTIERALAFSNQYEGEKVTIQLRGGTYYLDKTVVLEQADKRPSSLLITPYKNEKVIISAGRRLSLQWKPYRKGIFQAVLPQNVDFERLYVNGRLQVLARYPNYDSTARVFHGTAADVIAPERVRRWKNPVGGYVHALHAGQWGGFHYRITGVDDNGNLQLEGGWQNNRPAAMHKQFRFVENIFEELDAPGEWWVDKTNHILYYYPSRGVSLSTASIEVSHLKNSMELHGTAEKPLTNIELKRLNFAHNERSFMDTKEPLLRSDWTIYRGGALLFQGTENCKVTDCNFTALGGNAIMLSDYNKQDTISGCLVEYIGANAVCFVGDPKAVRSPLFGYEKSMPYDQLDKTPGPVNNNYPQECVVTDNLFHNLGEIEKQATGVEIEMSSSIMVLHNSIYNTPRAGINIGDGCWGGHVLAYNDVFNTVLETGDHGAFNSWGRDRYWSADRKYMDSLVAVFPELILLDAQKQNSIHDNRFRCDHGWDIDLDDGSTNYHIYNNVCLNGGLKLREGFYRIVENNILINNSFHPHVWFKKSGDVFEHNIVMKKYFPIQIAYWGDKIDYNLFPDSAALQGARENGTDAHSAAGGPLFTDPGAGNYTVAKNSPALALGFRNFPMDEFGVRTPGLRKMALRPDIPVLMGKSGPAGDDGRSGKSKVIPFLGGRIKSVEGLGERSAFGLPDETGVIVVAASTNSLLAISGVHEKDVIVSADKQPVKDTKALFDIYQSVNWKGEMELQVFRNQQPLRILLKLK